MKRLEASSIDLRLLLEVIEIWMSVEECNCNIED
jgi:hypothetical protein